MVKVQPPARRNGLFSKDDVDLDLDADTVTCPSPPCRSCVPTTDRGGPVRPPLHRLSAARLCTTAAKGRRSTTPARPSRRPARHGARHDSFPAGVGPPCVNATASPDALPDDADATVPVRRSSPGTSGLSVGIRRVRPSGCTCTHLRLANTFSGGRKELLCRSRVA